jgi:hypothetical protein
VPVTLRNHKHCGSRGLWRLMSFRGQKRGHSTFPGGQRAEGLNALFPRDQGRRPRQFGGRLTGLCGGHLVPTPPLGIGGSAAHWSPVVAPPPVLRSSLPTSRGGRCGSPARGGSRPRAHRGPGPIRLAGHLCPTSGEAHRWRQRERQEVCPRKRLVEALAAQHRKP